MSLGTRTREYEKHLFPQKHSCPKRHLLLQLLEIVPEETPSQEIEDIDRTYNSVMDVDCSAVRTRFVSFLLAFQKQTNKKVDKKLFFSFSSFFEKKFFSLFFFE